MDDSGIMVGTVLQLGPVQLTNTIVTTWVIMAVIGLCGWLVTRRLHMEPGPVQTVAEGIVSTIEEAIRGVAPDQGGDSPTRARYSLISTVVPLVRASSAAKPRRWLSRATRPEVRPPTEAPSATARVT